MTDSVSDEEESEPFIVLNDDNSNLFEMLNTSNDDDDEEASSSNREESVTRKRREPNTLPPKGSREYLDIRNRDAKRRREMASERHKCPFCDYKAAFPNKIKRHISQRHVEKKKPCKECGLILNSHLELRKHIAQFHPVLHVCEHCDYSNKVRAMVQRHLVRVHQQGIPCTVPGCTMIISKNLLRAHLAKFHSKESTETETPTIVVDQKFSCPHCSFTTSTSNELDGHVERIHSSGIICPFSEECGKVAVEDLKQHIADNHADHCLSLPDNGTSLEITEDHEGSSAISISERITSTTSIATDQVLSDEDSDEEHEDPQHKCIAKCNSLGGFDCHCGKTFKDLYLLKKHVKRVHEKVYKDRRDQKRELKHKCEFEGCTKAFATTGLLDDHHNKHKNIFPYKCDKCSMSFFARARFAVHLSKFHQTSIKTYNSIHRLLPQMNPNNQSSTDL